MERSALTIKSTQTPTEIICAFLQWMQHQVLLAEKLHLGLSVDLRLNTSQDSSQEDNMHLPLCLVLLLFMQ